MNVTIKKQVGFTIVELLIVIVVIGILSAITIVAYNSVQGGARDTTRKSDLRQVMTALEIQHAETGEYPSVVGVNAPSSCISAPHWGCWGFTDSTRFIDKQYISTMPQDPRYKDSAACSYPNSFATRAYYYSVSADRRGYILGANLESANSADPNYLPPSNRGCGSFVNWGYIKASS